MKSKDIWTIIGGGNGGQTFAGHLAMLGCRVRLYSKNEKLVESLNETKIITLHHEVEGTGSIEFATTDMAKAMEDATNIVMILPSNWHYETTKRMIPYLRDGQNVLILPEASCGAIAFRKVMKDEGCTANIILGAGATLPYATRALSPGDCYVHGLKRKVKIAALPATDNEKLYSAFGTIFPYFELCNSVIETSADNINLLVHPSPVLLNISRIEAEPKQSYEYYKDGITPSVAKLLEAVDAERIAVVEAFGGQQRTLKQEFVEMYQSGTEAQSLYELIHNNKGYFGIMNAKSLHDRYFTEDIPYSMESIRSLGKIAGVPTPCMDAVVTLGRAIMGDQLDEGRTLNNLGLQSLSKADFLSYVMG